MAATGWIAQFEQAALADRAADLADGSTARYESVQRIFTALGTDEWLPLTWESERYRAVYQAGHANSITIEDARSHTACTLDK